MAPRWPSSLVLAGAGKMGGAMLRCWLDGGLPPEAVSIFDPHLSDEMRGFCETRGIALSAPVIAPEALVLAVKPQIFAQEASTFAQLAGPGTLVVSILAGQTLSNLRAGLPQAGTIVRAMPNLPASVGRGATGLAAEPGLTEAARSLAQTLIEATGLVEWLDESLIDAVTAVSGSGPAYVFLLAECLAEAGIAAGLPEGVAARLARATVQGAGELMTRQPELSPRALREAVTSPGGTTQAALEILRADLGPLLSKAVEAAKRRAGELAS